MIVPETRHVAYRATHAQTFFGSECGHSCAVVELRFVTERKK